MISCGDGLCLEGSPSLTCVNTGTDQNPVITWDGMIPRCEGECKYGITLEELLVDGSRDGSLVNLQLA